MQPLYRRASAFFNLLRDSIVGIRGLRDTQCGLKVFDGELARYIFSRQQIDGFMFDVETMYIAQRLRSISELGVRWADAPESKVRLSSGLRLLPDLTRIRLLHRHLTPAALLPPCRTPERPLARALLSWQAPGPPARGRAVHSCTGG